MSFTAQYPGECIVCGGQVIGTEVDFNAYKELTHVKCPESEVEAPARTPLCDKCWTYHNGDCL